jgi:hypothetical protein
VGSISNLPPEPLSERLLSAKNSASALAREIFGLSEAKKERFSLKFHNLRRLMMPREEEREFALPREY